MIQRELFLPPITLLILIVGLTTLSSAAPGGELGRQLLYLGIAVLACGVLFWLGRARIMRYTTHLYLATLGLLVLTQFFGTEVNGAQSWLYLGPLPRFQPSELAKLTLIMVLAVNLRQHPITQNLLSYLRPLVLIGLPMGLIVLEPDLGTAIVLLAVGAGIMLVRGIPRWHLALLVLVILVAAPTVVWPNLQPHQKARVVTFLNPAQDPQGSGYQVIQARIAIGSGGLWGKGYKQGTQGQLGFIPYRHTDFIFPVLAEEGGFVAAAGLLLLYTLLFWRLVAMAVECANITDQLAIIGVLTLIGFQVLVNIGVTLGLAPVTGITLPLVSHGGTSLISTLVALSYAYVVHRDRFSD
jgi:rod shape determining protein RodA